MKLRGVIVLLLALSLAQSMLLTEKEENSIVFDLGGFNKDYLDQSTVRLVALKKGKSFSVEDNDKNNFSVSTNKEVCATIEYQKKLNETGWDIIYLDTNEDFSPQEQMECAGFLEGMATKQSISDFMYNIIPERQSNGEQYKAFFNNAYNNLLIMTENPPKRAEKYWKTAGLFVFQLIGMKNGYNAFEKNKKKHMELWQISLLNIDGQADEIDTIIQANSKQLGVGQSLFVRQEAKLRKSINHKRKSSLSEWERVVMKSRCSVFLKFLTSEENGNKILNDVFASHSTWENYSAMNRIYKFYRLPNIKNQHTWVQMSSYPGAISSTDDFLVKQGKFMLTETSIQSLKENQVSDFKATDVDIPDFIRIQAATSIAETGMEWAKIMSIYGEVKMYSSEWLILDFQRLQKGKKVPENSVIVLSSSYEQQIIADKTEEIINSTYFASFNNPHNQEIRDYLGYTEAEEDNELFSLDQDPRHQIFKHFQGETTSIEKVKWLMLHNSYNQTPLEGEPTFESPVAALGARGDLKRQSGNFGEVDVKVVSLEHLNKFEVEAISGPSHQEQPIFVWTENTSNRHQGQPQTWDFDWVSMSLKNQND